MNVHIDEFEGYGYTVLEDVFPSHFAECLAELYFAELNRIGDEFVFGWVNKMVSCWDLAMNSQVLKIVENLLGDNIRIGAIACKRLRPGMEGLRIHTDGTEPFVRTNTHPPLFMVNTIIALTDFSRNNGAFCVIPFSHLCKWNKGKVLNQFSQPCSENHMVSAKPIECSAGSVILWDPRLWHGHYKPTGKRLNINISYYPDWCNVRIELNHQPVLPEVFEKMPAKLQSLLRYKVGRSREEVYEV